MRIIAAPRAAGKTTKLIQIAKATNGYLLVHSYNAYEYCIVNGMPKERILRLGDFRDGRARGRNLKGPIYIDDLDVLFKAVMAEYSGGAFPIDISAASISVSKEDIDLLFSQLVEQDIILKPTEE